MAKAKTKWWFVRDYLKLPYSRIIIPNDGGFTAKILEFPGCIAEGRTVNEVYDNLELAAIDWLEAVIDSGQPIPETIEHYGPWPREGLPKPKKRRK